MKRIREELRYEPTEKRMRAMVGDTAVVESTRALLVWEPRRLVPSIAVPVEDVQGELRGAGPDARGGPPAGEAPAILHPGIPFNVHLFPGEVLSVHAAGEALEGAAFRPADPDLDGYVVLDFDAFDLWHEEEEPLPGHPRDPFHRVDVLESSRHVRIELDGELLAESSRPYLLFETSLPMRFYLPPEDLRVPATPVDRRTICAYKGEASYFSLELKDGPREDLVWSYAAPRRDVAVLKDLVAFFDDKLDVTVDGEPRPRPHTAISAALLDEFGVS